MKAFDLYWKYCYVRQMRNNIRKQYKNLPGDLTLTKAQEAEIRAYWKNLTGHKVSLEWHRFFYRRTGHYSPQYVPSDLYYSVLIGKFNHFPFSWAYTDKNLTDKLLISAKQPESFLKNVRGYFYIGNEPVSREEALSRCRNLAEVIIKPSFAAHGESVRKLSVKDGICFPSGEKIEDVFNGENITKSYSNHTNIEALEVTDRLLTEDFNGLAFINLVDTDMLYGHRNDIEGYAKCLENIDEFLSNFISKMKDNDILIVTGDHGNDPTTPSTDHSREYTPLLIYYKGVKPTNLGTLNGFYSLGKYIEKEFDLNDQSDVYNLINGEKQYDK